MAHYDTIPKTAKGKPTKFTVSIPDEKLQQFKQLIKLSPIGPETYENLLEDRRYGVSHKWLRDAKDEWENHFDWRAHEKHINSFPNYKIPVKDDDGRTYDIHFIALFSEKPDAIPLAFFHGWPGSFLEFLPILSLLRERYSPSDLPYHVIVPSLPGYAFSSRPPRDEDFLAQDLGRVMHKLLIELGFESGYVAQGGDIGSIVARVLGAKYDACKAIHLNFCIMEQPDGVNEADISDLEKKQIARANEFNTTGRAYALEHGTRPATIGLVLSASPIALLAWIGEKFLTWTDVDPPISTILESVSLYWLTDTFPTSIYTYRQPNGPKRITGGVHANSEYYISKPLGYSWFPLELAPIPIAWVATTGNLVWHRQHPEGGHFAALERPEDLLKDVEEFVGKAWNK